MIRLRFEKKEEYKEAIKNLPKGSFIIDGPEYLILIMNEDGFDKYEKALNKFSFIIWA